MDFGLIWALRNPEPWRRPDVELYRDTLEEIRFAESLGIESAWVTEHHFMGDRYLPSVMPMLGAIAASTTRIRIGTYVLLMPMYNPVRLAEDIAVVDIISGGRLEVAIGTGYRPEEFDGFGLDRSKRGKMQDEGVEVMLRAWRDEKLDFQGDMFTYTGVDVTPKPVQKPHPRLYLGGISPNVLERVARLGVTGVAGRPRAKDMPAFIDALTTHGRTVADVEFLPFTFLWVDRDGERARRVAAPYAHWVIGQYAEWHSGGGMPMFQGDIDDECTMGDPAYCIERIEKLLAKGRWAPARRLLIQPPLLGLNHEESMRLIETFAHDVMPHFANWQVPVNA
jgi:alkanesulfonate monooxygenase SsuD/methylene tetrahydromethanopterin reductase-like flavin-dependent oxidoreductase (luciferase family)